MPLKRIAVFVSGGGSNFQAILDQISAGRISGEVAIMGVLRGWTEEDTKNLDRIVHQIYVLLVEGVSPYS